MSSFHRESSPQADLPRWESWVEQAISDQVRNVVDQRNLAVDHGMFPAVDTHRHPDVRQDIANRMVRVASGTEPQSSSAIRP